MYYLYFTYTVTIALLMFWECQKKRGQSGGQLWFYLLQLQLPGLSLNSVKHQALYYLWFF